MVKTMCGEHRTWDKHFWAYAVHRGAVVLVRCESVDAARDEMERMRFSESNAVGISTRKVSELQMRKAMRERGLKVSTIR